MALLFASSLYWVVQRIRSGLEVSKEDAAIEALVCSLKPNVVVVMSGKRKSGKDYLAERLCEEYVPSCLA